MYKYIHYIIIYIYISIFEFRFRAPFHSFYPLFLFSVFFCISNVMVLDFIYLFILCFFKLISQSVHMLYANEKGWNNILYRNKFFLYSLCFRFFFELRDNFLFCLFVLFLSLFKYIIFYIFNYCLFNI